MLTLLALVLGVVAFACASSVPCPIHDGMTGVFTGKTRSVDGHLLYEYHCPRGHDFWARCS